MVGGSDLGQVGINNVWRHEPGYDYARPVRPNKELNFILEAIGSHKMILQ